MKSNANLYFWLRKFTKAAYPVTGIGLGRLCEAVRSYASRHAPDTPLVIDDFRGGAKFRCFLREHMGGQVFFRGSYSGEQLLLLEKHLNEDSVFIDIGANQGEFSIAAARIATQGTVIAFEPVAEYRERLLANAHLNQFENIVALPLALGEADARVPIYDADGSFSDGTRHEGVTTLFSTNTRNRTREHVDVRRLDDVLSELKIENVHVMKLDIEGGEWAALKGAVNTIQKCRPVLILEIASETCRAAGYDTRTLVSWLHMQNYRLERILEDGATTPLHIEQLEDYQNVIGYPL